MEKDNQRIIESQLENCNFQIEGLVACVKNASAELGKQCEELISDLIAYRDTLERDLLKCSDERNSEVPV